MRFDQLLHLLQETGVVSGGVVKVRDEEQEGFLGALDEMFLRVIESEVVVLRAPELGAEQDVHGVNEMGCHVRHRVRAQRAIPRGIVGTPGAGRGAKPAELVRAQPPVADDVAGFQQQEGLVVDGIVGPATWSALIITVRQGSQGDAVRGVQEEFQFRNLSGDPNQGLQVDGIFGPQTDTAVRGFQQALHQDIPSVTVDGIVGPITWQALVSGMLSF